MMKAVSLALTLAATLAALPASATPRISRASAPPSSVKTVHNARMCTSVTITIGPTGSRSRWANRSVDVPHSGRHQQAQVRHQGSRCRDVDQHFHFTAQ